MMKNTTIILLFVASCATVPVFATNSNSLKIAHFSQDSVAVDSVQLADFVGKYRFHGLPIAVHVSIKQAGKLHVVGANRVFDLPPVKDKPDTFETAEGILRFVRNDKNEVIKLVVNTGDDVYEGSKLTK